MTTGRDGDPIKSVAFIEHLLRFPEDLRDIRRLQRRYCLTATEAARALEAWGRRNREEPAGEELSH